MRVPVAIAACLLLLGCQPTVTVYYRTSPRRVEISKQVSPSSLYALAIQAAPDGVDVHLKRTSRVTIRRVLHYNSAAIVYDHNRSVYHETLELLLGLLHILAPISWGAEFFPNEQDTPEKRIVRHRGALLAYLDPTTSGDHFYVHVEPIVKQQIFSDAPTTREYEIRIPAPEVNVAFRVLDEAKNDLARGSATTDPYGELQIRGDLSRAVAVEISTGEGVIIVPIQPSAPPVEAAPIGPAAMPHAPVGGELVNEEWTKQNQDTSLPRVSLTIDVVPFGISSWISGSSNLNLSGEIRVQREISLSGEVRVHRKFSVGGLVWRESISTGDVFDTTLARSLEVGGYLRFYIKGDFGAGAYLGLEWLSGASSTTGPIDLTSYGPTLGYKFTSRLGGVLRGCQTFELAASLHYLRISDPLTQQSLVSRWRPIGHINLGWSF